MDLLAKRSEFHFGRVESAVLATYGLLAGWLAYVHEPWSDEAQAWLIARDSSLSSLFFRHGHYEGAPGLWHFLLWVLARLHLPFAAMHVLTVLLGLAAVYVWLRFAPVPTSIRLITPFCFALLYQTAVVARSYSLMPLLVFSLCIEMTRKRSRPILIAALLGLLANSSLLCMAMAIGLAVLYVWQRDGSARTVGARVQVPAALVLGTLVSFGVYTALPAPDISYARGAAFAQHPPAGRLLSGLTGIGMPSAAALASAAKPVAPSAMTSSHTLLKRAVNLCLLMLSSAFFVVSSSNWLAASFYSALLCWLVLRRGVSNLLPMLAVLAAEHFLGFGERHASILWTALMACIWLSWAAPQEPRWAKFDKVFAILLFATLLEQMAWTAFAAKFDAEGNFDGGVAAAKFLAPLAGNHSIAGYGPNSAALQPYFAHNIYMNQKTSYWPWRLGEDADSGIDQSLALRPEYVVLGQASSGNVLWPNQIVARDPVWSVQNSVGLNLRLSAHGYQETHTFCGMQPAHFGFSTKICLSIYEPAKK